MPTFGSVVEPSFAKTKPINTDIMPLEEEIIFRKTTLSIVKLKNTNIICDLRKHRIYDMVEGKSASKIESYLMSLKGRLKVKAVCIDLSSSYRSIVKRVFPNAKIVADRFHVISLAIRQYMEFCKKAQEKIR